ncbi:hypothetical protein BpHYR1_019770 [Brachionus plicatilis]|uniref:Uncharacterized protein n=1 Tax=Brachionus plicatilis TaxID=10195 RepID=A0A3M7PQ61_BRAPC|nr:hypothetical protein BpHYR1_019770 [Brachionus plicatilis]
MRKGENGKNCYKNNMLLLNKLKRINKMLLSQNKLFFKPNHQNRIRIFCGFFVPKMINPSQEISLTIFSLNCDPCNFSHFLCNIL